MAALPKHTASFLGFQVHVRRYMCVLKSHGQAAQIHRAVFMILFTCEVEKSHGQMAQRNRAVFMIVFTCRAENHMGERPTETAPFS
jgi:hypothetical protein